jgi:hypothetical protein
MDPNTQPKIKNKEKSTEEDNTYDENNNKCYDKEKMKRRWNVRRRMKSTISMRR